MNFQAMRCDVAVKWRHVHIGSYFSSASVWECGVACVCWVGEGAGRLVDGKGMGRFHMDVQGHARWRWLCWHARCACPTDVTGTVTGTRSDIKVVARQRWHVKDFAGVMAKDGDACVPDSSCDCRVVLLYTEEIPWVAFRFDSGGLTGQPCVRILMSLLDVSAGRSSHP